MRWEKSKRLCVPLLIHYNFDRNALWVYYTTYKVMHKYTKQKPNLHQNELKKWKDEIVIVRTKQWKHVYFYCFVKNCQKKTGKMQKYPLYLNCIIRSFLCVNFYLFHRHMHNIHLLCTCSFYLDANDWQFMYATFHMCKAQKLEFVEWHNKRDEKRKSFLRVR